MLRLAAMKHVLQHRQAVHQIVVLEDHAHLAAQGPQVLAVLVRYLLPVQQDGAAADGDEGVDGAQQGGLTRTGGADHRDELPFRHGEVDTLQRVHAVGIVFGHIVKV